LFATHPKPYTLCTSGSFKKRDLTIDRRGVEATHAFVLSYYRATTLLSLSPNETTRRKSPRCCANLVPQNRGRSMWGKRERGRERGEGVRA